MKLCENTFLKDKVMQTVFSSRTRLESIARDIIFDFETKSRLSNGTGNAILIAESVYSACKYYEIFQNKNFKKCAIISSFEPNASLLRTEITNDEESTETFEKYETYQKMLNGKSTEDFKTEAKTKFIEQPANMKLLIVVNKLLTGFPTPPLPLTTPITFLIELNSCVFSIKLSLL